MILFSGNKAVALTSLAEGASILIPCLPGKTVQQTQSSITSLISKQGLNKKQYSQKKALLVTNEHTKPIPVIIVTRQELCD